jgi:Heterokaryon incompatibility protein (HET)
MDALGPDMISLSGNPWIVVATTGLLVRRYRPLLIRICWIGLLLFNYSRKWITIGPMMLNDILMQIYKPSTETSRDMDRYYQLKVAELVVCFALHEVLIRIFPDHETANAWAAFGLVSCLGERFYPFHHFTFRCITRVTSIDNYVLETRGYWLELACRRLYLCKDLSVVKAIGRSFRELTSGRDMVWTKQALILMFLIYLKDASEMWQIGLTLILGLALDFKSPPRILAQANRSTDSYTYRRLKKSGDIRLLLVYPRLSFLPIKCSLLDGPLTRILMYEAVSYTWGAPGKTKEIWVDDKIMMVTESAYEILDSSSSLLFPRLLWIDSLCINQDDDTEKAEQVQLMGTIYGYADLVYVWLGRSVMDKNYKPHMWGSSRYATLSKDRADKSYFEETRLAFSLLKEPEILRSAFFIVEAGAYNEYAGNNQTALNSHKWRAFLSLLCHPWFQRIWVVQEVALAQKVRVIYGREEIDWDFLASSLAAISHDRQLGALLQWSQGIHFGQLQQTSLFNAIRINQLRGEDQSFRISDVLANCMFFKATNPRDLIFGIYGIYPSAAKEIMAVDYSASVKTVYVNAARALCKPGDIELLLSIGGLGHGDKNIEGLPSWVPDWTTTRSHERNYHNFTIEKQKLVIGPAVGIELSLSGFVIDCIKELGPMFDESTWYDKEWGVDEVYHFAKRYNELVALAKNSPLTTDPYSHSKPKPDHSRERSPDQTPSASDKPTESLHEALVRSLCGNQTWRFGYFVDKGSFTDCLTAWEADLKYFSGDKKLPSSVDFDVLKRMNRTMETIRSFCSGRRLFIGLEGYIGICPRLTMPGDLICTVPGIAVPFILRETGVSGRDLLNGFSSPNYFLIGDCYVHGMRCGEGLPSSLSKQEFSII